MDELKITIDVIALIFVIVNASLAGMNRNWHSLGGWIVAGLFILKVIILAASSTV